MSPTRQGTVLANFGFGGCWISHFSLILMHQTATACILHVHMCIKVSSTSSWPLMAQRGAGLGSWGLEPCNQDAPRSPSLTRLVLPPSRPLPLVPRVMVTGPRALSWALGAVASTPLGPPIQLVLPSRTLQPLPALPHHSHWPSLTPDLTHWSHG